MRGVVHFDTFLVLHAESLFMSRHPTKIVSSEHLVSDESAELSELEYALIMASNAFKPLDVRCMSAAGEKDMTAIEVSLLHHVSHRERRKKLADICFVLNIEDTHVATYALKKLVARGYVKSEKTGKEVFFSRDPGRPRAVPQISRGAGKLSDCDAEGKRPDERADRRGRPVDAQRVRSVRHRGTRGGVAVRRRLSPRDADSNWRR